MALKYGMKQGKIIEFCQENAVVIANTLFQEHKRQLYSWTSPDSQMQKGKMVVQGGLTKAEKRREAKGK